MRSIKISILAITLSSFLNYTYAQTINWNSLNAAKHMVSFGFGIDYSLSYSVGYTHKLNSKIPIAINTNFSIPAGENLLDDFKVKTGGQIIIFNSPNFKASMSLNGIYRRYESPYVRLQNFGSEMKGIFGLYKSKWFVVAEFGFDKAIVTHFKHSKEFKETIYANVVDGWYEPATGGNFYYGLQTGYTFKRLDLALNLGRVITQDFKTAPLLPFYLNLGCNIWLP